MALANFTPKDWQNKPSTATKINASALEDLETRVTDYAKAVTNDRVKEGTGSPEGVLTADPGTLYVNRNGGDFYFKATGTGNTGWIANLPFGHYRVDAFPGSTDTAKLQAAFTAVSATGGVLIYGRKRYSVDTTSGPLFNYPVNVRIEHLGLGASNISSSVYGSEIFRSAGTNPLIRAVGTSSSGSLRPHLGVTNLSLHGNNAAGTLVHLERCNEVQFEGVRIRNSAGTLLYCAELWNSRFAGCFFTDGGTGTGTPATVFDSYHAAGGSDTNTVHLTDCEWEGNTGTDLYVTGRIPADPGGEDHALFIHVTNFKMERTTGAYPLIDLDRAAACHFVGGALHLGGTATGPHVQQKGDGSTHHRPNTFTSVQFSNSTTSGLVYFVDQTVGFMKFANCGMNAVVLPTTAFFHIGASVLQGDIQLANVTTSDRSKLLHDERPNSVYGYGTVTIPPHLVTVSPTHIIDMGIYIFPDGVENSYIGQITLPADSAVSRPVRFRVWWYSDATSGDMRLRLRSMSSVAPDGLFDITTASADQHQTVTVPATGNRLTTTTFIHSNGRPGESIRCKLSRLGADGLDTAAGGFRVWLVEALYEKNL